MEVSIKDDKKEYKCQLCGIVPRHIDHCGEFGNCYCPYFGIKGDEVEKHIKERDAENENN